MVNGSKVYNVRFYSPSIIHGWKRQERERGKGGQEQAEGERKRERRRGKAWRKWRAEARVRSDRRGCRGGTSVSIC